MFRSSGFENFADFFSKHLRNKEVMMKTCLIVCILLCCILVSPGFAQEATPTPDSTPTPPPSSTSPEGDESQKKSNDNVVLKTEGIVDVLIIFVVLSVVFEVALTPKTSKYKFPCLHMRPPVSQWV